MLSKYNLKRKHAVVLIGALLALAVAVFYQVAAAQDSDLHERGVLVAGVVEDGPAFNSGLRRGNIILAIDDVEVDTPGELLRTLRQYAGGEQVTLRVLSGSNVETVQVTLADEQPLLGVQLVAGVVAEDQRARLPELDRQLGVVVAQVAPDSAAQAADLQIGDRIVAVDNEEIEDIQSLQQLIAESEIGDTLTLTVERDDEQLELGVTLGAHPDDEDRAYLGVQLRPTLEIMPRFDHPIAAGLRIVDFSDDSALEASGAVIDDIITGIDGQPVNDMQSLIARLAQLQPGETTVVQLKRGERTFDVEVELGEHPDEQGRAFLGVSLVPAVGLERMPEFRGELLEVNGLRIIGFAEASAAEAAGVEIGDVLEALNGQTVEDFTQLSEQVAALQPGEPVTLTLRRGNRTLDIDVELGAHPEQPQRGFLGVQLMPAPQIERFPGFDRLPDLDELLPGFPRRAPNSMPNA